MSKTSKNIFKTISLFTSMFIINGCISKQADGTYPSTYSYHPYNKNPNYQQPSSTRPTEITTEQPWTQSTPSSPTSPMASNRIINLAIAQMGKTYQWAATGPDRFDCSGFTTFVYKKNGIPLPRTSIAQSEVGDRVTYNKLKEGDLIFFRSTKSSRISHTGIYLGKNLFIHASSAKNKVIQSRLDSGYYKENFQWGRRFTK
ncbi:MAG: C40 family peptidase [Sulfurovaceae bacterium]|nr:C40 family peptidase [Sulfurovaceae bacterium]